MFFADVSTQFFFCRKKTNTDSRFDFCMFCFLAQGWCRFRKAFIMAAKLPHAKEMQSAGQQVIPHPSPICPSSNIFIRLLHWHCLEAQTVITQLHHLLCASDFVCNAPWNICQLNSARRANPLIGSHGSDIGISGQNFALTKPIYLKYIDAFAVWSINKYWSLQECTECDWNSVGFVVLLSSSSSVTYIEEGQRPAARCGQPAARQRCQGCDVALGRQNAV